MDYQQLVDSLTPQMYEGLRQAVELGKWPDGRPLTAQQRETCLQALIAYDLRHKPEEERIGYIHTPGHDHCGGSGEVAADDPQPLKWRNQ